jgi:hypothetical protein
MLDFLNFCYHSIFYFLDQCFYYLINFGKSITIKELFFLLIGIFFGWLITHTYSKSTERTIDITSKDIKHTIIPAIDIISELNDHFNKLTKYYSDISELEIKSFLSVIFKILSVQFYQLSKKWNLK